ncbi:MAG TPA: hypothetical protein VLM40_19565, partial [Gemmata sp.]|nr:hypothetical protein [Gemmata sp.]
VRDLTTSVRKLSRRGVVGRYVLSKRCDSKIALQDPQLDRNQESFSTEVVSKQAHGQGETSC